MKELILKYQALRSQCKEIADDNSQPLASSVMSKMVVIYDDILSDLSSLQSKGKTKEEVKQEIIRILISEQTTAKVGGDGDYMEVKCVDSEDYDAVANAIYKAMEEYAQSHANKDGWVSCADKKADVINIDGEWIEFEGAPNLFTEMANKNCMCRFDDGTECRYMDEHPQAVMTHFQITP